MYLVGLEGWESTVEEERRRRKSEKEGKQCLLILCILLFLFTEVVEGKSSRQA
jgi:hypothetical protein